MADTIRLVIVGIVIGLVILVGIPIYDAVVVQGDDTFKQDVRVDETVNVEGQTGSFVSIRASAIGINETVRDSRGHAVQLTGADDSKVTSDASFSFASDGTWTVSTWANVSSGAGSENMTAISLDGRVLIDYNGSQGNWSVWYYDEGARESWRANVSAPNQPGNLTMVTATHNGTHLVIYRNATQGDVVNTSAGDNLEPIWVNNTNWNGDIDETRTFDDALSSTQVSTLHTDPIGPLKDTNRTARLMYDAGSGTHVNIYWASTDATGSNISYVTGLQGQVLADNLIGGDYDWRDDGPEVRPKSGGEVDGAPALFVEYDLTNSFGSSLDTIIDAIEFVPIIILTLMALGVYGGVRRFRRP